MHKYDPLKLENQICFPLYALSREITKLYTPLLDKYGLTYTQYVTMMAMWENERIVFKELGKILHLDSGTLTPVIKKLEAMQLVYKYRSKQDDRIVIVELTNEGKQLKEQMLEIPQQMACKLKGSEEVLSTLKKSLDDMLKNLKEIE